MLKHLRADSCLVFKSVDVVVAERIKVLAVGDPCSDRTGRAFSYVARRNPYR
jgi:hypothetical protein